MSHRASYFIEKFNLTPHPEGGYYSETYRSDEVIKGSSLPEQYSGDRHFSTAIYFLLEGRYFSSFHRIQSDEIWHFYYGDPLNIYVIQPEGQLDVIRLGNEPEDGSAFQAVVKAGCWFACKPVLPGGYSFVGCTVAPGFDFADFELADRETLAAEFPKHAELISALCR